VVSVPNDDRYVTTPVDSFLQGLQTLAYEYVDNARTPQNSLTYDEEKTLSKLKMKVKDNSLIITKANKGNATVITKKDDYVYKMNKILSDSTKFQLIENPPKDLIQKEEKNLNDMLR